MNCSFLNQRKEGGKLTLSSVLCLAVLRTEQVTGVRLAFSGSFHPGDEWGLGNSASRTPFRSCLGKAGLPVGILFFTNTNRVSCLGCQRCLLCPCSCCGTRTHPWAG